MIKISDNKCGNCRFFVPENNIKGFCDNSSATIPNKHSKSKLSKSCYFFEQTEVKYNAKFTETDKKIIDNLLFALDKKYPTKINKMRSNAIKHLLEDLKSLEAEM